MKFGRVITLTLVSCGIWGTLGSSCWAEDQDAPSVRSKKHTAVHLLNKSLRIAAREDRMDDLKSALEQEAADVNSRAEDGTTALMYASRRCLPRIAALLIEQKADVNLTDKRGMTALMHAIRTNCLAVVKQILATPGLKIHLRDVHRKSAADYARAATILEVDGPSIEMRRLVERKAER